MKVRKSILLRSTLAAIVAAFCAGTIQAQILTPDADTSLSNDSNRGATINHGSSSIWQVRSHTAPRVRIGYVRYDITGVDSGLFSLATLSGTFRDSGKNGPPAGGMWDVYGLNDNAVGNDWDESTVNYSNAAGVDNAAAEGTYAFTSDATHLGTISLDGIDDEPFPFASTTTDLDLTAFLSADTDGWVTFMFMDVVQEGSEYYVDSKEGNMADGHGPMRLSFVVPEPTTFALFGFGSLAALMIRRAKR